MKIPFGKYKGKEIVDLPSSYLLWIAENVKEDIPRNKMVVKECDEEWCFREKFNMHFEEDEMEWVSKALQ